MFGTLGGPEVILILVVALIVFGPRRLPEIGKSMGKMLAEFRKASNDFKRTIEDELEAEKVKEAQPATPPPTPSPVTTLDVPPAVEPGPLAAEPAAPAWSDAGPAAPAWHDAGPAAPPWEAAGAPAIPPAAPAPAAAEATDGSPATPPAEPRVTPPAEPVVSRDRSE